MKTVFMTEIENKLIEDKDWIVIELISEDALLLEIYAFQVPGYLTWEKDVHTRKLLLFGKMIIIVKINCKEFY